MALEAGKGPDEPKRNEDTEGSENPAHDSGEKERIEVGDAVEGDDGSAECSEGDGGGVGEESQTCGLKRWEAESDEDRSADGYGSSEARCSFEEGAERERDQEKLEAAVWGDADETVLQLRESAGADGELIQEENREDDPADGEESVADAETGCENGQADGHVKDDECDGESGGEAEQGGDVSLDAQAGHGDEKNDQWERGKCCGEQPEMCWVVALGPGGCEVWRLFEDDGSNDQDDCGKEERNRVAFAAWGGCWGSEGRLFGQDRCRGCGLKRMTACWFAGVAITI